MQRQICVIQWVTCGYLITYVKKVSCVQFNIFFHLCKILRFCRNVVFYISIYWNVKFASSHVNYTFTHAKILTYKKIMLNWTFSQLTFFLTHVSKFPHVETKHGTSNPTNLPLQMFILTCEQKFSDLKLTFSI